MERNFCPITGRSDYSESRQGGEDGPIIGSSPFFYMETEAGAGADSAAQIAFETHLHKAAAQLRDGVVNVNGFSAEELGWSGTEIADHIARSDASLASNVYHSANNDQGFSSQAGSAPIVSTGENEAPPTGTSLKREVVSGPAPSPAPENVWVSPVGGQS